jgi:hypothetical protein
MWEVLVFGLIQLGQSPHRERDQAGDTFAFPTDLKTLTVPPVSGWCNINLWFGANRHACSPCLTPNFSPYVVPRLGIRDCANAEKSGSHHLTTAGDDASGINTTGCPLPSAGTTQTSDVVASDPGRGSP